MIETFKQIGEAFLGIAFVIGIIFCAEYVFAQNTTLAGEATKVISEAEQALVEVNNQILSIESIGSLPTSSEPYLEVSLSEVTNKLNLSKTLLDQAKVYFDRQEYQKSSVLATNSKRNTMLLGSYFYGISNVGSSGGFVPRLKFQGTIQQIVSLKSILGVSSQLPQTQTASTTTATTTQPIVVEPVINPKALICIEKGVIVCNNTELTCITNVGLIANTCQTAFETNLAKCEVYTARAETRLPKCDTNFDACRLAGKTLATCEKARLTCQKSAQTLIASDLKAYETCKQAYRDKKVTCDLAYNTMIATKINTCKATNLTCQANTKTRCLTRYP